MPVSEIVLFSLIMNEPGWIHQIVDQGKTCEKSDLNPRGFGSIGR